MDIKKKIIKKFVLEILVFLLIAIIFGSLFFISPFYGDLNFIDEGQFGAWANHMINGKQIYKDIYIPYGPLLVYPLFLLFRTFGASAFLVRLYLTLGAVMSVVAINILLYLLNIKNTTRRIILLVLILIPGLGLRQGSGYLVLLFVYLSLVYRKNYLYLLTGVFSIASFLVSPDIGIFSFILCFIIFLYRFIFSRDLAHELKKWVYFLQGLILTFSIFSFWSIYENWFWSYINTTSDALFNFSGINTPNGKNFPLVNALLSNKIEYSRLLNFTVSKDGFLYWLLFLYIGTFFYFLIRVVLKKIDRNDLIIGLLFIYGMSLYTVVIGRPGHIFFVIHPAIIISVIFIEKLICLIKKIHKNEKFVIVLLITLLSFFNIRLILMFRTEIFKAISLFRISNKSNINQSRIGHIHLSSNQISYINTIAKFIDKNTNKFDYIFFLSDEPMIYLLTNRVNPTRYDLPFIANTKEKRYELVSDLEKRKPKFIFHNSKTWAIDGIDNLTRIPEIKNILESEYAKDYIFDGVVVYRTKN